MPSHARRRRTLSALALACTLTVWIGGCQRQVTGIAMPPANVAVIDSAATADVRGAVEKALEAVLSYDTGNLAAHRATVRQHLTPAMRRDFRKLLPDLSKQHAIEVESTVTESAAATVTRERAVVLCYVAQTSTRTTTGDTSRAMSAASAVIVRKADGWKLARLTVPPAIQQRRPATHGAAAVRDAAVAAAREIAGQVLSLDPGDPEGTLSRWRSVATGSYHRSMESNTARYREDIANAEHRITATAKAAGATNLDLAERRATVLVSAAQSRAGESEDTRKMIRMTVAKEQDGWKAARVESMEPS